MHGSEDTIRLALRRNVAEFAGDIEIVLRKGEEFQRVKAGSTHSDLALARDAADRSEEMAEALGDGDTEKAEGLAIAVGGFLVLLTERLRDAGD